MHHTQEMLQTHPQPWTLDAETITRCLTACFDCAQTCTNCADACLNESHLEMLRACIRLNLDCADVCATTGRMLSRQGYADWNVVRTMVQACMTACQACGAECEKHAEMHEHCRVCAEACRACEEACREVIGLIPA
jgi:hypothetical protein